MARTLAALAVLLMLASGCLDIFGRDDPHPSYADLGWTGADTTGRSPAAWPDLDGVRLVVLDVADWEMLPEAIDLFEDLTGADVVREPAESVQGALDDIDSEQPGHAIVFGFDQVDLSTAWAQGSLRTYTPLLASRAHTTVGVLGDEEGAGVPFQHRYVSVQWHDEGGDVYRLRERSNETILPDPVMDPLGRAFLLTTIDFFGEDPNYYDWQKYWRDLLAGPGCVSFVSDAETAYADFLGLENETDARTYNATVAYTHLPSLLRDNGTIDVLPQHNTRDRQTWHEVTHSAIVNNTGQRAAAEAWQEFLLTEAFQELVPDAEAYPVAGTQTGHFEGAPEPGSFRPAFLPFSTLGPRWAAWETTFEELRPNGCIFPDAS